LWASVNLLDIDTSCEYFKAELGRNLRLLGLNVDGVDNHFSTQKGDFEMPVNGMTQRQALWVAAHFVRHPTCLTAFPSHERCWQCWLARQDFRDRYQQVRIAAPTIEELVLNHRRAWQTLCTPVGRRHRVLQIRAFGL
jgi:hypothetical protein